MSYMATKYYPLHTKFGTLIVWANGQDADGRQSLGFRTEAHHNRRNNDAPAGGWDAIAEVVTINRVDYRAHGFARVSLDTGEIVEMNPNTYGGSLTRAELFSLDKGSDSANAQFDAEMTRALSDWAKSDDGRRILREGRMMAAHNDAERVEREISELDAQLKAKRAELRNLRRIEARNAPAELLACDGLGTNHSGDRAMVGTGSQDGPVLACGFHAQNWTVSEMRAAAERKARRNA